MKSSDEQIADCGFEDKFLNPQFHDRHTLSIIIPTLNEEQSLRATLDAVKRVRGQIEVIVVDGGSLDKTLDFAREYGARVVTSERGRGAQLHAGANVARGEVLWFLHADTLAAEDACEAIGEALCDAKIVGGNFTLRFDGTRHAARFLTRLYPQLRKFGLFYGDSGMFVRRDVYERTGGFKPFPIFEDLDLLRRLRRHGRIVNLPVVITTSSRRFEGRSFASTFARWATLQGLYWLGVHPRTLGKLYAPIRKASRKAEG